VGGELLAMQRARQSLANPEPVHRNSYLASSRKALR
jgi:hypothetical protein